MMKDDAKMNSRKTLPTAAPIAPRWNLAVILLLIPTPVIAYLTLDEPFTRMSNAWPIMIKTLAELTSDTVTLVPLLSAFALFSGIALTLQSTKIAMNGFYGAASLLLASGVTHAIKPLIGRARPTVFDQHGLFGRKAFDGSFDYVSFPSGHATHAAAFFAAIAFCFPRYTLPCAFLALWFAGTRLVLGVHYPSDVIAGLLVGTASAFVVAHLSARIGFVFQKPKSPAL